MQTGTELQAPFSYSLVPIILLFILLFLPLIIQLIKKVLKEIKPVEDNTYNYRDPYWIKNTYLNKLLELENKVDAKQISNRKAFQELSILIRSFVKEVTGLDVTTCTLSDIERLNIPVLSELMREYYSPEFAKISLGNIKFSISNTREVINRWN